MTIASLVWEKQEQLNYVEDLLTLAKKSSLYGSLLVNSNVPDKVYRVLSEVRDHINSELTSLHCDVEGYLKGVVDYES